MSMRELLSRSGGVMISPVNGNRAAAVGSAVQKHLLDNAGEGHAQVPVPEAAEVGGES
jgi:hypothetical protein